MKSEPGERYDTIGATYARTRRADPRIEAQILAAIGDARTVLNVGAGSGNYEPRGRSALAVKTLALEPSEVMIAQRATDAAPVVRAVAEAIPVADMTFDVGMAILTLHHWQDLKRGLVELKRVSRRQIVLYFEPRLTRDFWVHGYFPEMVEVIPTERDAPGHAELGSVLDVRETQTVMVPHDCLDGFGVAYWARPEAYLDPTVQAGMSWMAMLPPGMLAGGTTRLREDLVSGEWDATHGHLRQLQEFDGGYRLALAGG